MQQKSDVVFDPRDRPYCCEVYLALYFGPFSVFGHLVYKLEK